MGIQEVRFLAKRNQAQFLFRLDSDKKALNVDWESSKNHSSEVVDGLNVTQMVYQRGVVVKQTTYGDIFVIV